MPAPCATIDRAPPSGSARWNPALPLMLGLPLVLAVVLCNGAAGAAEPWTQLKYDSRRSGDVPRQSLSLPLGLVGAVPLSDAIFTAPVIAEGRVYVVDGAGTAFCLDAGDLRVVWRVPTRGGQANCNNVSSPALAGRYLHFGTTAGVYYVLDVDSGTIVREIPCGEPIFSAPVVGDDRVYFATLGSRVHALKPDGEICWTWDFVREQLGFSGDRWSGAAWAEHLGGRATLEEQFLCSRDVALDGRTLVIPAGGTLVWLDDLGPEAKLRRLHRQHTATFGLSIADDGTVYRQWHWLDNLGQVDILRPGQAESNEVLRRTQADLQDFELEVSKAMHRRTPGHGYVPGTKSNTRAGLLGFASVSLRGQAVYRCRPEENFGFCAHAPDGEVRGYEGCHPAIASPVLIGDNAVYGGLDGTLYVVPLAGGRPWSFRTPWGKAISAPVAVYDGRVYFGSEDGYLYVLGPGGSAPLPTRELALWGMRGSSSSPQAGPEYDRYTSFHDWGNTNADDHPVKTPVKFRWIRRYEGTVKHFSSFGGGRMYTHTAEGQVFAVEQETGRLLWRRYFPGVFVSYTTPLYHQERLLVPQAGPRVCRLRCLDAATGDLVWEAPFSGSPSWNRQQPPVVYKNLVIYMFGTGRYDAETPADEKVDWLFGHQDTPAFPASHRPLLRAYDLRTGREVWTRDFSEYGSGGDDAGVCLMDGRLYYSCFFGHSARLRRGQPGPQGVTAALDPETGTTAWVTTAHSLRGGCTISAKDGRLYLGGYNPVSETRQRHVWCLDARDGSLVWRSEPLLEAIKVPSITERFIFIHAQYKQAYLLDKETGKILGTVAKDCKCTAFSLAGACMLGPALDVHDLSDIDRTRLLSTGPRLDPSECVSACVSNGRIYYTGNGGGLQACQVFGDEAASAPAPWAQE